MTFLYPWILRAGVAIASVVVAGTILHTQRRRRLASFIGGPRAAGRVSPSNLYRFPGVRSAVLVAAVASLSVSAAEPRRIDVPDRGPAPPATSIILAVDVSASMQSTDVSPNRLAEAVRAADAILREAEGSRAGLILFAGKSYTLAPLTYDINAVRFLLEGVTPTIVSAQDPGSLLSVAIRSAVALLGSEAAGNEQMVVVISDGESGESDPEVAVAVQEAAQMGASVHTIGVGTLRGGQMLLSGGNYPIASRVLDATGTPGVSRLQEALLQRISQIGGGTYAHSEDRGALRTVYRSLQPSAFSQAQTRVETGADPTVPLAVAGLLLLVLDGLFELPLRRELLRQRVAR